MTMRVVHLLAATVHHEITKNTKTTKKNQTTENTEAQRPFDAAPHSGGSGGGSRGTNNSEDLGLLVHRLPSPEDAACFAGRPRRTTVTAISEKLLRVLCVLCG